MKSHSGEQVNLLGSCFPVKGMYMKEMLYAVRCLKSNEDMILALAGQVRGSFLFTGKHIILYCCHTTVGERMAGLKATSAGEHASS